MSKILAFRVVKSSSLLTIVVLASVFFALAKETEQAIFRDKVSKIGVSQKVEYGEEVDESGRLRKLRLLITAPQDKLWQGKRPAIIWVHPGAFVQCGGGVECFEKSDLETAKPEFVTRGFVAATVEYRLNRVTPRLLFNEEALLRAHARAIRDLRSAVKFVFDNADKYDIDENNVFLVGYSAGAIAILHSIFLDEEEKFAPNFKEFAPLAPRQSVKAAVAVSGAIYNLDFIDDNEKTPLALIHGQDDFIVPYGKGKYFNNPFLKTPVYGSSAISAKLASLGTPSQDLFVKGLGHEFSLKQKETIYEAARAFIRSQMQIQPTEKATPTPLPAKNGKQG